MFMTSGIEQMRMMLTEFASTFYGYGVYQRSDHHHHGYGVCLKASKSHWCATEKAWSDLTVRTFAMDIDCKSSVVQDSRIHAGRSSNLVASDLVLPPAFFFTMPCS